MKNPRIIKVILISLFFGAFTQKVFCIGAGIQIGCSPSLEFTNDGKLDFSLLHNVTGTLKLSKLPMTLGAGISLRTSNAYDSPFLGFSAFTDYYILDIQLKNIWSLYSGLGLSGNLLFNTKLKAYIETGLRFFTGFSWIFLDNYMELNTQLNALPTILFTNDKPIFKLDFPLEVGLRWHF